MNVKKRERKRKRKIDKEREEKKKKEKREGKKKRPLIKQIMILAIKNRGYRVVGIMNHKKGWRRNYENDLQPRAKT